MGKTLRKILRHPGAILHEKYLTLLGIEANLLAPSIRVTTGRINNLLTGRQPVNADMSIRLGRFFGENDAFWLNLQYDYDLSKAEAENDYSAIRQRAA